MGGIAGHSESREEEANRFAVALPHGDQELENTGIRVGGLGDAGEVLDEPAKAAYRRGLTELRAEVAEAKRLDHFARAEQAEEEIAALLAELSRAVGLGGRDRRAASAAERARQSVESCAQDGGEKNCGAGARAGDPLRALYQDVTCCSYTPDPGFPIRWEVEWALRDATTASPERLPASTPLDSTASRQRDHCSRGIPCLPTFIRTSHHLCRPGSRM